MFKAIPSTLYRAKRVLGLLIFLFQTIALAQGASLTLVYSGNLDGELEPCGCTLEGDFGGLSRRATMLDQLEKQNPGLVLVSTGGLFHAEFGSDEIKNRFILKGFERLDYDAIGVQWADLIYGVDFLTERDLPVVAGNWLTSDLPKGVVIERAPVSLFFTQWLDDDNSPYAQMQADLPIQPQAFGLRKQLEHARKRGLLTIVGSSLPLAKAQATLPMDLIDILLVESGYEQYAEPRKVGHTLVLQPGSRGQRLGRLDLEIRNGKLVDWQQQVIELSIEVADSPRMEDWYAAYNEAVREEYERRVALRKDLKNTESPFAGDRVCQACHADSHQVWSNSLHADAFAKLEVVGKQYDPNCIGCHTVGFLQPGGYLDEHLTPQLKNVQCENCHGAAAAHAKAGGQQPTPNKSWSKSEVCAQCHNRDHSPIFNMETYWPRIAHPIHNDAAR